MSKNVKLGSVQLPNVLNLVTFSRSFNDHKQYLDLQVSTQVMGWRAYDIRLTRPLKKDFHNGTWYALKILMPSEIRNEKWVLLPSISINNALPLLGDTFIKAMWHQCRRLAPRITNVEFETRYRVDYFYAYLEYVFIDPLFFPYLVHPVSVATLDKTALDKCVKREANASSCQFVSLPEKKYPTLSIPTGKQYHTLTTLDDNHGRGLQVGIFLEQLTQLYSSINRVPLKISCLEKVRNTMVRIKLYNTYLLKEILDAISYSTGLIWEWVNHNHVLFIPSKNFGQFSRTYQGAKP